MPNWSAWQNEDKGSANLPILLNPPVHRTLEVGLHTSWIETPPLLLAQIHKSASTKDLPGHIGLLSMKHAGPTTRWQANLGYFNEIVSVGISPLAILDNKVPWWWTYARNATCVIISFCCRLHEPRAQCVFRVPYSSEVLNTLSFMR